MSFVPHDRENIPLSTQSTSSQPANGNKEGNGQVSLNQVNSDEVPAIPLSQSSFAPSTAPFLQPSATRSYCSIPINPVEKLSGREN